MRGKRLKTAVSFRFSTLPSINSWRLHSRRDDTKHQALKKEKSERRSLRCFHRGSSSISASSHLSWAHILPQRLLPLFPQTQLLLLPEERCKVLPEQHKPQKGAAQPGADITHTFQTICRKGGLFSELNRPNEDHVRLLTSTDLKFSVSHRNRKQTTYRLAHPDMSLSKPGRPPGG